MLAPALLAGSLAVARPAFASGRPGTLLASSSVSSGPIIVLGLAVVLAVVIGFAFAVTSRRKKQPTQCAEQRSALEAAERALTYWEAAVAHLQSVEPHAGVPGADDPGATPEPYRYGRSADMSDEEFATLVKNAVDGRDAAAKHRDQCQIDLIVCMGQSPTTATLATPGMSAYERPTSDAGREDSPHHMENS